jgi:FKBP-type peptidyl-prolyl cis-trans isomerase 2
MKRGNEKTTIELGMKVSIRRSTQNHIGVVTRVEGDYVTPLAGWL